MATVILVRHGRTTANADGILAGRAEGVSLDDVGIAQANDVGTRLASVPLARIVSSPLSRCKATASALRGPGHPPVRVAQGLTECDYGDWQGRSLKELAQDPLWATVQSQPSAARFPSGESMPEMAVRAAAVVRRIDGELEPADVWAAVTHGDVIKAILADALGLHLDLFQRIQVDPGSVSIVRYGSARPQVVAVNTHAGDLSWLAAPAPEASVGGGAGPVGEPA